MRKSALVAAILAGATLPAVALASPFDGTWKLDTAKSRFTGDTFTYAKTATGWRFSNGSTVTYAFAVDGKDYPTIPSRTIAWSKAADGGWDVVAKDNGKVRAKTHRSLSPDGRTMTETVVVDRPDGTTVHERDVYTRVSGAKGLAGEWRDTQAQASNDMLRISTSSGAGFVLTNPGYKEVISGRLDGSPSPVKGPTVPPGATASYKAAGPRMWSTSISLGGKVYGQGMMTVSADGKTLTNTSWVPGKKNEAEVAVYRRQ